MKPSKQQQSDRRDCTSRIALVATPLLTCAILSQLPQVADAQPANQATQALTAGAYFARGDYGETLDTRISYLPLGYEFDTGKWGFQVLVPQLRLTGLGNVLVNVGGVTRAVASNEVTTSRGLGDSLVSLLYHFDPVSASAPFIDLRLDIKLPTADERQALGTGEVDYSAQLDLTQAWGNGALFASLGYTVRGQSALYPGLTNSGFVQLGGSWPVSDKVSVGAYYDYRQSASAFAPEVHELVPFASWQLTDAWSFSGLLIWGFTDASADEAVFGQLRYSW